MKDTRAMSKPLFVYTAFFILALTASPVLAEDKTVPSHEAGLAELERKSEELKNSLNGKMDALTDALNERNKRHFYMIYNNYNMIATVKNVRKSVGDAIKACGENNPDIKEKISRRFEEWKGAVNTKIEEAEGQTNNMILAQSYAKPKDIRTVLKKADEVRDFSENIYEKVPVTSAEACEYLHNKMDETQDNMIGLLETTLVSVPLEMQKVEEDEEAPEIQQETQQETQQDKTTKE